MMKASFIFSWMRAGCSFGAVFLPVTMPNSAETESLQEEDLSHSPKGCIQFEKGASTWRYLICKRSHSLRLPCSAKAKERGQPTLLHGINPMSKSNIPNIQPIQVFDNIKKTVSGRSQYRLVPRKRIHISGTSVYTYTLLQCTHT